MSGYYRRFIRNYSKIALPLTDILAKERFEWSSEAQYAFNKIKAAFAEPPLLKQHDHTLPTRLETDTSGSAIGAVLHQQHGKRWHPVAFYSSKLAKAERNYPVHEQELLAIIRALEHWRHFLMSGKFEVITDHRTIEYFPRLKKLSRRQARWLHTWSEFEFDVHYRKGSENTVADALSRSFESQPDAALRHKSITSSDILKSSLAADNRYSTPADTENDPSNSHDDSTSNSCSPEQNAQLVQVLALNNSSRGDNGFGSTGIEGGEGNNAEYKKQEESSERGSNTSGSC